MIFDLAYQTFKNSCKLRTFEINMVLVRLSLNCPYDKPVQVSIKSARVCLFFSWACKLIFWSKAHKLSDLWCFWFLFCIFVLCIVIYIYLIPYHPPIVDAEHLLESPVPTICRYIYYSHAPSWWKTYPLRILAPVSMVLQWYLKKLFPQITDICYIPNYY